MCLCVRVSRKRVFVCVSGKRLCLCALVDKTVCLCALVDKTVCLCVRVSRKKSVFVFV